MRELISELRSQSIYLSVDKDELVIDFDGDHLPDDLVSRIKSNKLLLIDYLRKYSSPEYVEIPAVAQGACYPVSSGQMRLWVLSNMEGGSVAYNIPGSTYLTGDVQIDLFRKAVHTTVERHEILRTVFKADESGEVKQWILEKENAGFEIHYKDLREEENREVCVKEYMAQDLHQPFDLVNGPLLRAALLQTEDNVYVFCFNIHHIIGDGWSTEVLSRDVLSCYDAYKQGRQPALKPLRIQYKDYTAWQLDQAESAQFASHKAYWLGRLKGELPLLDLPGAKQRPRVKTYKGQRLGTYIGAAATAGLKEYARQNGGSLFMGLLAAWNVLMYRYTAQTDIIIGTPIAGRGHADLEDQIGFYVNTLALRNEVKPGDSFHELFARVRQNTLQAYSHQMYPFDRLVEELDLQRDTSRSVVFDMMLMLQSGGKTAGIELSGETLSKIEDLGACASKFDLDIRLQETGACLSFEIEYNTDIYERETIEGLMAHYRQLVEAVLENPGEQVAQVKYLSAMELDKLLNGFNIIHSDSPAWKTLVALFEEQVKRTPEHIAIQDDKRQLSYRELHEQSDRLAAFLVKHYRLQPSDRAGIKLGRTLDYVVALLAVQKASACCVPLNTDFPEERLAAISSDLRLVIDRSMLEEFKCAEAAYAGISIKCHLKADDLAYILYTSGSTGEPKGVMLEHRGIINHLDNKVKLLGLEPGSTILHASKMYFVGGIWQLWAPLISGGRVLLPSTQEIQDISALLEIARRNKLRILEVIPSQISNLLHLNKTIDLSSIEKLILTGEPLKRDLVENIQKQNPGVEILNTYGLTECSDVTTMYTILPGKPWNHRLAGWPIRNVIHYIVDENGALCPTGVTGEICISGVSVSRGYLNREELTRARFMEDPFRPGNRLCKTGDLGRWRSDGSIELTGRKDNQVKIRGYRIELAEIEHVFLKHEQIEEVVVLVREDRQREKELVAYFTARGEQCAADLRAYLKALLPDYMLPSRYIQLEELPLTGNGKIDRKLLPDPENTLASEGSGFVAPRTELEKKLVNIWEAVLQRSPVGVRDDFFSLGGHSLKAVRLSNEYRKELSVQLSLKDLFAHTTIEAHTALIGSAAKAEYRRIEPVRPQASYAISNAQRRLWVLSQFGESSVAYNMPGFAYLDQEIEIGSFKKAIEAVIERHEILRTVFRTDGSGEVRQWILKREDLDFRLVCRDLRNEEHKTEQLQSYIREDALKPFDLVNGPLLRATLLQVEDQEYVFYYNIHHIIGDEWSVNVLNRDTMLFYEAFKNNNAPALKPLRIQYKDYSDWQLTHLSKGLAAEVDKAYWLQDLKGELGLIDLPGAKLRPKIKTHNGYGLSIFIDPETTSRLKAYSQEDGGSTFMGLLAVWNVLIYRYTSLTDIITGTPVAGREHADLEDQIGFYVNTLVLRNELDPAQSFNDFYKALRTKTLKSYDHRMYPFDQLVEELGLQRDTSRSVVFDISMTYHNILDAGGQSVQDELKGGAVEPSGETRVKNDIELHFREESDYLLFNLKYNTDIYDQEMISGLMRHFVQLLKALLDNPSGKLAIVDFLDPEEKNKLLLQFNATSIDFPEHKTVLEAFKEQVHKNPENTAILIQERSLSYSELDRLSDQLAQCLVQDHAITAGDLVGIQLEKSEWTIVAMFGVLKAGAAYVPVDPEYPSARKSYIAQDTGIKLLITEAGFIHDIDYYEGNVFAIDVEFTPDAYMSGIPGNKVTTNDLAYIIYTSGTSGTPKGVMIGHEGLLNMARDHIRKLSLSPEDRVLQFVSFTFDGSVLDIFMTLLSGAALVIPDRNTIAQHSRFIESIEEKQVTVMTLSPVYLRALNQPQMKHVRTIITAGDAANVQDAVYYARTKDFYNAYGPTEGTVNSTLYKVDPARNYITIPIGRVADNKQLYILNDFLQLQPLGVPGEICISGKGLARGYLNNEEFTREKFVASPFKHGERLYRTGDLGKWLPDGTVEFIGRKDNQVKIRGYRIELGEIEQAMLTHEQVREAVVLARLNQDKEKELVAYITGSAQQNAGDLRAYLKERLPDYMLPAHYVQLAEFPLNANGKIDKKALPDPSGASLSSGVEYTAPGNELEEKLVNIWQEILDVNRVGIHDKFYDLGGDSIKVLRIIAALKRTLQYELSVADIYTNDTVAKIAAYISDAEGLLTEESREKEEREEQLRAEIEALKQRILRSGKLSHGENVEDIYPMSDIEKGMVVAYLMNEGSGVYHDQIVFQKRLTDFDPERIRQTLCLLVEKHPILRTSFHLNEHEREVQIVHRTMEPVLHFGDVAGLSPAAQEEQLKAYLAAERSKGFEITKAPLWRMSVYALGGDNYAFVFQCHHAIMDGWSEASFKTELNNIYLALGAKPEYKPEPLRSDYKDFIIRHELDRVDEGIRNFWKQELSGYERLDLFTDQEDFSKFTCYYGNAYFSKIEEVAKKLDTTVKVVSLCAYIYLLKILNYSPEIVTGLVTNLRPAIEDGDRILGCFLNTVPLRVQVDTAIPCSDFIRNVHVKLHTLKKNERLSMLEISSICRERTDLSNPFFDVFFNYVDFHAYQGIVEGPEAAETGPVRRSINVTGHGRTNTFLDFNINTTGGIYALEVKTARRLRAGLSAEQLADIYFRILDALAMYPAKLLGEIDYLSAAERQQVLHTFNATDIAYPEDKTLVDLFNSQAERTPDATALLFEGETLSFRQLDEASNRLARYLQTSYGIKREDLVAVKQERSCWMLVSILAVLKAGAAYVPVDPAYPAERVAYIEKDTQYKVCLDKAEIDRFRNVQEEYSAGPVICSAGPKHLAYVIYTSGSTGQPKGVLVEHTGVVNRLLWMQRELAIGMSDVFLQKTPVTFDVSVWELFLPLISGSRLVIARPEGHKDPAYLEQTIAALGVSVIHFVPSMLAGLAEHIKWKELASLRHVVCSGEALTKKLEDQFREFAAGVELHNYYGPTEASVDVTSLNLTRYPTAEREVSIGKPVDNTGIYIVNEMNKPQALGILGEILIGGVQVARGYLNKPGLSSERFIDSPFKKGDRLYRTGDLGRWRPDGTIEFTGRKDHQVKIRGFRIEPGEIEYALLKNPQIREAVVLVRENQDGEKELVAYITAKSRQSAAELRAGLKEHLPEYMIPAHYVQLDAIPLSANGKIDRSALPAPLDSGIATGTAYMAPANDTEKKLVEIWEEILHKNGIGVKDDFFALGGNSIKAMKIISAVESLFHHKLDIRKIFADPTIGNIALEIENAQWIKESGTNDTVKKVII